MRKVFFALFLVDFFLAFIIYMWKGQVWLINSQVAFFSSSLIMLASMQSYKSMVLNALDAGAVTDDGRDTLDKLEDPYDLYDDLNHNMKSDEEKSLVEVVKEERENLKKGRRSMWETTKDAKASFSFYRLGAYGTLVLGFFYLNLNKLLELIPYLLFLSIPPIIIVLVLMQNKEEQ
jgi:hypothetical protein